ncbi:MAG: hypothetical protein RI949_716 [Pseudomonadota bacterium]|jgi:hypothetical protein
MKTSSQLLQGHTPSTDVEVNRRHWLGTAGSLVAGLAWPSASSAASIDMSFRVPARRLDALVAAFYKDFNKPVILPDFNVARDGARYDVDLHRLVTTVKVPETGEILKISGLLAVPVGAPGPLPVLSWQHGTVLSFGEIPSNLLLLKDPAYQLTDVKDSVETLLNVHRFAGQGYAVIAADYVGKGPFRNGRGEGYAVKDVTTHTCMRILDVGVQALRSLKHQPGPLFLNGWSQGAVNTQWLHQALRAKGFPIRGTAVQSPFTELTECWRFWAGKQTFDPPEGASSYPAMPDWVSLCMIITLGSFELHYRLDGLLKVAVRPEFRDMAAKYWSDYELNVDPAKPFPTGRTLLVPGFFTEFTDERNSAFLRRMAANTPTFYRYDAPIRFYYGMADEALHPTMVQRAIAAGGGQTAGIPVAGGSHRGNFLASLYGDASSLGGQNNVLEWFNARRR